MPQYCGGPLDDAFSSNSVLLEFDRHDLFWYFHANVFLTFRKSVEIQNLTVCQILNVFLIFKCSDILATTNRLGSFHVLTKMYVEKSVELQNLNFYQIFKGYEILSKNKSVKLSVQSII